MKVKVLKSSSKTYWYANQIGKLFEVVYDYSFETHYRVVGPIADEEPGEYMTSNRDSIRVPMISKRDCIEVPDEWCVKVGNDQDVNRDHPVILYLNEKYSGYFDGSASYYGIKVSCGFEVCDATFRLEDEGPFGKLLTLEEFELIFLNNKVEEMKQENKKLIGYKLNGVATAQQVATLAECDPKIYSNGCFLIYPDHFDTTGSGYGVGTRLEKLGILDIWFTPVYEEETKTIISGDQRIYVEIIPGRSICALGTILDIKFLEEINVDMNHYIADNNNTKWAVSYPSVKIGCSTFTSEEINKIIEVYYGK